MPGAKTVAGKGLARLETEVDDGKLGRDDTLGVTVRALLEPHRPYLGSDGREPATLTTYRYYVRSPAEDPVARSKVRRLTTWGLDEPDTRARAWTTATGRLTGPEAVVEVEVVAYRAGDRVVILTPERAAVLVTSQRATVTTVDPDTGRLVVRTDHDRQVTLGAGQIGTDRVGHADATTMHRLQGFTVERAHLYADGGGNDLRGQADPSLPVEHLDSGPLTGVVTQAPGQD